MKVSAFCIVCAAFRRCVNRGGCFHAKQNKECSYHTFQLRRKSKQFLEYDTGRRESVLIQENSAVIRRPKGNESRSDLLVYATIKHFGTDPRNYKPDGLAEMMKNYFHPYWFANEHLKQEEVEQGFQALSDRKGMLSVAEPNKNEMVDAGFRNGNGKIICSQQKLDEEAEKELNIYLEYLGRYKREYFLDDFHFYGWQVMSDSVEEPEAVKVDVDGEHHVHIEFNTKDHTPSPIMAALSFLFSKEMLYVKYASNDIAAYEDPLMLRKCGFYRCKAGHFTEGFGLRGYEAAEEACRMWGYTLSDYVSEGVVNGKYRVFWHKHKA